MPFERRFIDWRQPALASAVDHLVGLAQGPGLDLRGLTVAVSGAGAGRRLLELLVDRAEQFSVPLVPPRIVTAGQLPELLYEARQPFASDTAQQLAWVQALRRAGPDRLAPLVASPPADDDWFGWLALGRMLAQLHRELAGDALDFAAVAERGSSMKGFTESARWRLLSEIQRQYLAVLDSQSLWDLQTARLFAIEHRECKTAARIVLLGTVDLNRAQRAMLDQVADRVTALVFAPADQADRFDEHGCLLSSQWLDLPSALHDEQIEVVDGPLDQAEAVAGALAALDGRYSAEQITIGVADESAVPYIAQRLAQSGVATRHGVGTPLSRTGPYRLLEILSDYVESGRFASLARMVRHPGVAAWLLRRGFQAGLVTRIDKFYNTHLPSRLDGGWPANSQGEQVRRVQSALDRLAADFNGQPRALADWVAPILQVLVEVYGGVPLDRGRDEDRLVLVACDILHEALASWSGIPSALAPSVRGPDALRLALESVEGQTIPSPVDPQAVELAGWLELPMDDAPALVVTGFNETIVPAARNGDLFLPNELRRQLQVEDNDRRFARDCYALCALAASRKYLRVIAGRRTRDNDPLAPSRLLFDSDERITAERASRFFGPSRTAPRRSAGRLRPGRAICDLGPPRPVPLSKPVVSMRVTEFAAYLACRYRYYLGHRLNLQPLDDRAVELDPLAFGTLMHEALQAFGQGPLADASDAEAINAQFGQILDAVAAERFLAGTLPAVAIQIAQARKRLEAFAHWQAVWRREGWRIMHCETSVDDDKAFLSVDGEPMFLRGRIDRIDRNERTGEYRILDYKTGDTVRDPNQVHRTAAGEWVDLQLPLYRHLARPLSIEGPIELGYVLLPKDLSKVNFYSANWSREDLDQADRQAEEVIRGVRAAKFWPPAALPPAFSEQFAAICGDGQFNAALAAIEDEQEEGDA